MNLLKLRSAALGLAAALLLAPSLQAAGIVAVADPLGPVNVGDEFDVNFSVTGWNPADPEVDLVSFRVAWDPAMFDYVSGSVVSDGTEFLAETNQGAGYSLSDNSVASFTALGIYLFNVSDVGDATRGSIGGGDGAGTIGTLRLKALTVGTDTILTSAPSGIADGTFGDTGLTGIPESTIGTVSFGGASMEVVPEPSTSLLATLAGALLVARRRRRTA